MGRASKVDALGHASLAAQIAEMEVLRASVGHLPVGTRIAWRDESMLDDAEGVIASTEGCDFGYRLDTGAFVLWKSHELRVLAPDGEPQIQPQPQPQNQRQEDGAMVKETTTHRRNPETGKMRGLSDEARAERLGYLAEVDRVRGEGNSLTAAIGILAARPPYSEDTKLFCASNYLYWHRMLRSGATPIAKPCATCGKKFAPTGNNQSVCAVCGKANGKSGHHAAPAKSAKSATPLQAPCSAPAAPEPSAACAVAPVGAVLHRDGLEQTAGIVATVIEAILRARPVRYDRIAEAAECGRKLDLLVDELADLLDRTEA